MASIGNGISYSAAGVLQALSNLQTTVVGSALNTVESLVGPYRPPQWSGPATTFITVPGTSAAQISPANLGSGISYTGTTTPANTALGGVPTFGVSTAPSVTPDVMYVFDAVLSVEHTQEMEITQHPVQSGADISDHAYQKPFRMTMDIGMSDVMDSYVAGQWSGSSSKSINAYQTMLLLERSRTPITVGARLNTYPNMLIESIHTKDDVKTKHGLRATIVFRQLFWAVTSSVVSARPQDTGTTGTGTVPTQPVPAAITNNYQAPTPAPGTPSVTGSGNMSSNPIGS
jgi:hypothetical protein